MVKEFSVPEACSMACWLGLFMVSLLLSGCGGSKSATAPNLQEQYEQALKIPDAEIRARRLVGIAQEFVKQGNAIGAEPALEAAELGAQNADRPVAQADLYLKIFAVKALAGDAEHATELLKDASRVTRAVEEPTEQFPLLIRLARAYASDAGKTNSAKAALEKAEALLPSLAENQRLSGKIRYAAAMGLAGEPERSETLLSEAKATLESAEKGRARCDAMGDLAIAMLDLSRADEAGSALMAADQAIASLEDAEAKSHAYLSLGRKLLLAGEVPKVAPLLRKATSAAEGVGDPVLRASIMDEIDATKRLLQ